MNNKVVLKVLKYLSFKPRTEEEVKKYLRKIGVSSKEEEEIVNYLLVNGFLDNEFLKKSYIKSRVSKGFGRKYIKYKLSLKGLKVEDEDISFDLNKVVNIVLKKYGKYFESQNKLKLKSRIFNFISYRGFTKSEIEKVIKEIFK